jgi:predicted acylesterase/phospholipase RssA
MMRRTFGERRIEELPRDFYCVSADLISSRLHVHRRGLLIEAVGASTCLPAVFPPVARENGMLVDGGVLNNLPVDVMAARGEGPVVASDVSARFSPPRVQSADSSPLRRLAARMRATVVGTSDPAPRLQETLVRSITIGSLDSSEAAGGFADLMIAPELDGIGLLAFDQLDRIRETGRRAAAAALAEAPELIAAWR